MKIILKLVMCLGTKIISSFQERQLSPFLFLLLYKYPNTLVHSSRVQSPGTMSYGEKVKTTGSMRQLVI